MKRDNERSEFLGGSDAAAVLGVSPWKTPVELWREKTGRSHSAQFLDVLTARRYERGHRLEPFIRDMTIDKLVSMGLAVELVACNERYVDGVHPFMSCEIDFELELTGHVVINGEALELSRERVNVDAKSVSGFARKKWGHEGTEDVPIEYAAQFMHGLMVTGRELCIAAALRSFDDVDIYWTVRDEETIAAMREKEVRFWADHVLADEPPAPILVEDVKALFPVDNGQAVEATEDVADKVCQLRAIKDQIKVLEDQKETLEFEIGTFISPHARLTYKGKDVCTLKAQADTRLDQQAFKAAEPDLFQKYQRTKTIRVLRVNKSN